MKRCPQCQFIYEDDQSLCDMDGVLLVFDSRSLPNLHALATVATPLPEKGPRRSRMVPAFATFLLMLAIASVYYVSTVRNTAPPSFSPETITSTTIEPPASVTAEQQAPASAEPPAAEAPVAVPANERNESREVQPTEAKSNPAEVAVPTKKAAATKVVPVKPEPKKDDSKVESILKKTGKLIKKPFKF